MLPDFIIHSGTRIGYRQMHIFAGRQIRVGRTTCKVNKDVAGGERHLPPVGHGLPRVECQIHEHLFDLNIVSGNLG